MLQEMISRLIQPSQGSHTIDRSSITTIANHSKFNYVYFDFDYLFETDVTVPHVSKGGLHFFYRRDEFFETDNILIHFSGQSSALKQDDFIFLLNTYALMGVKGVFIYAYPNLNRSRQVVSIEYNAYEPQPGDFLYDLDGVEIGVVTPLQFRDGGFLQIVKQRNNQIVAIIFAKKVYSYMLLNKFYNSLNGSSIALTLDTLSAFLRHIDSYEFFHFVFMQNPLGLLFFQMHLGRKNHLGHQQMVGCLEWTQNNYQNMKWVESEDDFVMPLRQFFVEQRSLLTGFGITQQTKLFFYGFSLGGFVAIRTAQLLKMDCIFSQIYTIADRTFASVGMFVRAAANPYRRSNLYYEEGRVGTALLSAVAGTLFLPLTSVGATLIYGLERMDGHFRMRNFEHIKELVDSCLIFSVKPSLSEAGEMTAPDGLMMGCQLGSHLGEAEQGKIPVIELCCDSSIAANILGAHNVALKKLQVVGAPGYNGLDMLKEFIERPDDFIEVWRARNAQMVLR